MPLNVVLVPQRQSVDGIALSWSPMEGVASYQIFVAAKKLTPEELEAAQLLGGTEECFFAKVGGEVHSVVDDITGQGEARYYGVAMVFDDGTIKAARFKATPDGGSEESFQLSIVRNRASKTGTFRIAAPPGSSSPAIAPPPRAAVASAPVVRPAAPRPPAPAAAPSAASGALAAAASAGSAPSAASSAAPAGSAPSAASSSGSLGAGSAAPAASPAPEDPLEARKRAQREARARATAAEAQSPAPAEPAPAARAAEPTASAPAEPAPSARGAEPAASEEDPLEARKRAQREARERSSRESPATSESSASAEPPPPSASIPLEENLDARMQGATQTWDGLRLYWERDPRAAAYEIIASDHQIFGDELADALAGQADFTTAAAVAPSVTAVIDNVTARESRGWYLVLVRYRDGKRAAHPFKVGDAADSGKMVAPFLNPNRTGELRGEVEDLVAQAQEQWDRWSSEQDGGARREAKRLVGDAMLIWPNYPAAKKLEAQMAG